jgi:(1->4)-alpha-D-glucan 1-alpha-D-glucosylmutase
MNDRLKELLRQTWDALRGRGPLPESTYRLQFHSDFTFRHATALVGYLHDLGITHCYASPYLQARPGSQHGYDIIHHGILNPEVGSEADHAALCTALTEHGMGQILDTVPNHMGIATNDNPWWNDVLENGPSSRYAGYFDIGWHSSPRLELQDKVLLPVLGDLYGKVLESGELRLLRDCGSFFIGYYERRFPVAPRSYELILKHRIDELEAALGPESEDMTEYHSVLTAIGHLPDRLDTEAGKMAERQREKEVIKRRLATLITKNPAVGEFLDESLVQFNGKPGDPASFDLLDGLLNRQCYRLSFWRVASDEINYRRFFDINDLAALSMEREDVFEAAHQLIFGLLRQGHIHGLRVDHPDGLYDPRQYLRRLQIHYVAECAHQILTGNSAFEDLDWKEIQEPLRERIAEELFSNPAAPAAPLYVVVEKILGANEPLPADWPTHGTSGYDFLNVVNGLFVDRSASGAFSKLYAAFTETETPFNDLVYQSKSQVLRVALSSELQMLSHQLDHLAQQHRWTRDFTLHTLRDALRAMIAVFPVYRSYITAEGVGDTDRKYVQSAIRQARLRNPTLSSAVQSFIRDMLLLRYPEVATDEYRAEQVRFVGKFQQVTSPVMAKGLEDTAFYIYNRLISLNEVGGNPGRFGTDPALVHAYLKERQQHWPYALSPLSTHDTKRSEDVRARLNVLSEMPQQWSECLTRWARLNEKHKLRIDGEDFAAPDRNEECLLYQTLVGAWPIEPMTAEGHTAFARRIEEYLLKALHEAKVHTSWISPDAAYDEAVQEFTRRILSPRESGTFLDDLRAFQKQVSHYGIFNSLSQTLLRLTAPGVPDTYQGTELWDFSLVDPDNRRPVDYERRRALLQELQEAVSAAGNDRRHVTRELARTKEDGRIKLYLTYQTLHCRRDHAGLFSRGEYLPLEVTGSAAEHVFAFARREGDRLAVVAVPRLMTKLVPGGSALPLGPEVWQETQLLLPAVGERLRNVFTGEELTPERKEAITSIRLGDVLGHFPVALLLG